ncbi:biotinidase [Trichonephila clavata]|uniref:Biotinidase n=1 Tax=Trichonephila clavata TaxID=2740835 RepID=A0A8X6EXM8_TRICU|nr:biotinidase [Trichonephila clavata]
MVGDGRCNISKSETNKTQTTTFAYPSLSQKHREMASWQLFILIAFICLLAEAVSKPYYTVAVYEHNRYINESGSPKHIINNNLAFYIKAAKIAKEKNADIIVYPEYGIFAPSQSRTEMRDFLEKIPDPEKVSAIPCAEQETYSEMTILRTLSCIAKNNSIFIVANMGDIQNCEGDQKCPSDGVFQFNTNVVFDREGRLIQKYHKEHLYFELALDLAREQQVPTFQTDFGNFATYISFDVLFKRMSDVGHWPSIDAIMLTTMWAEFTPQIASIQLWQSWALANNCTLVASNIQIPGYYAVGSGVFHGRNGALAYTYNPDGISKLVIARLPKRGHSFVPPNPITIAITAKHSFHFKNEGQHVTTDCSRTVLNDTSKIHEEYRCVEERTDNYLFKKLPGKSAHMELCHNGMCCILDYTAKSLTENYYLGVYNGTHNFFERYFLEEENCLLVRCESLGEKVCAVYPRTSKTVFHHVQLQANFSTSFVLPTYLESGMKLVPKSEWLYEVVPAFGAYQARVNFKSQKGRRLVTVGFKGRCFDRDPPYIR